MNRFSIYNYLNLIFSGGILLTGLQTIGCPAIDYFKNTFGDIDNEILTTTLVVLICYVVGVLLQEIGNFFDQRITKVQCSMTSTFLQNNNKVVINAERLRIYQEKARQLFSKKNIIRDDDFLRRAM